MEYNNKAKTEEKKQQQTHRTQEWTKLPKEKGLGRMGRKGGRRELRGIMISTHNIGGHGEGSIAQRRQVVTL